ncbi:uncharacterized protein [Apostichopus japonicus]|uniref:uncharacterized protein isoform X1 n=2 Tax=Stichopus japonicus TaxID=307972 RepID=UPI003AB4D5E7
MFVECHVPVRNLCQALSWLSPRGLQKQVKGLYTIMAMDTFSEFRFIQEQVDKFLTPRSSCPACPMVKGKLIFSLDGIFGLKRWKKSGTSANPPRHGTEFFLNQVDVDNFVENHGVKTGNKSHECSSFQAGDLLRSKVKTALVDETGVFGAVCRHEVPLKFFSLKSGEKLGNAVFLLKHILSMVEKEVKLFVLYDIACKLESHLKIVDNSVAADDEPILPRVTLAVPAFHVYGPKPSCQMKYSPRRVSGFALSDGEQVERLWSFLRRFASITKEMTPSNRVDALTDALIHYRRRIIRNLPDLLVHRYNRAVTSLEASEQELKDATKSCQKGQNAISVEEIQQWSLQQESERLPPSSASGVDLSTEEQYVLKLKAFYEMSKEMGNSASQNGMLFQTQLLFRRIKRLDVELQVFEGQRGQRWGEGSLEFLKALQTIEDRSRKSALSKIHTMSVDRWFLIQLKKRYADGQTIAQRLCKQISSVGKKLKREVEKFNADMVHLVTSSSHFPSEVTFQQVCDVTSSLWNCLSVDAVQQCHVPRHVRNQLVDIVHKVNHSKDELNLLKEEMLRMVTFFQEELRQVHDRLKEFAIGTGQHCLLKQKCSITYTSLEYCRKSFGSIIDLPPLDTTFSPLSEVYRIRQAQIIEEPLFVDFAVNGVGGMEEDINISDIEEGQEGEGGEGAVMV